MEPSEGALNALPTRCGFSTSAPRTNSRQAAATDSGTSRASARWAALDHVTEWLTPTALTEPKRAPHRQPTWLRFHRLELELEQARSEARVMRAERDAAQTIADERQRIIALLEAPRNIPSAAENAHPE